MPKIVHLCLSCFFIDNYSYQENILPKHHVLMGFDVTVIASLVSFNDKGESCLLDKPSTYYDNKNKYKIIRIDYKGKFAKSFNKILRRYDGLYNHLVHENPDIIFMHGMNFWDVIQIKKYIVNHPEVKLFADSHADKVNSGNHIISRLFMIPILWRNIIKIIEPYIIKSFGVTPSRLNYIIEVYKFPKEKTDLLVLGVDDAAIPKNISEIQKSVKRELNINNNDFVVVTGGKIDFKKNIHLLLDAVNEINSKNVHVIIFGQIMPICQEYFVKFKSNNNFHFVGWSSNEEVMNYLLTANLACFPGTHSTLWEEAIGLGIPAIFKNWEGMTHLNINGNCKFVNNDSVYEIKNQILSLMNPDEYSIIKDKAILASVHFKYSQIAKKAIDLC